MDNFPMDLIPALALITAAVGFIAGAAFMHGCEKQDAKDLRNKLYRDLQDLKDDKKAAANKHARLMQHLTALTNDLYRRRIGRRCVVEELQVVKAVHAGTVDAYTTGCRTPRPEEQ